MENVGRVTVVYWANIVVMVVVGRASQVVAEMIYLPPYVPRSGGDWLIGTSWTARSRHCLSGVQAVRYHRNVSDAGINNELTGSGYMCSTSEYPYILSRSFCLCRHVQR